jgi:hypothetical protein
MLKFVRITENPAHKVVLGLLPRLTVEEIELNNDQLARLAESEQATLARLVALDNPVTIQGYEPIASTGVNDGIPIALVRSYRAVALAEKFEGPLTVDLVINWVRDLADRAYQAEVIASTWLADMAHVEWQACQLTDDPCYLALCDLKQGRSYIVGPYSTTWGLSSGALARMDRIETDRRIAADKINAAAKEARKRARADFVARVVAEIGDDNQKERLALDLLPMAEVEIMLHRNVLGTLYSRLCEDEELQVVTEAARLPAGAFTVFKLFKSAVDAADLQLIGEIKICPVVGYEGAIEEGARGARRLLCEVRIADDPKHSDWSSEAVYYLD